MIWKIEESGAWKPVSADSAWGVNTSIEDHVREYSMMAAKGAYYQNVWTRDVSQLTWSSVSAPDMIEDHSPNVF